MVLGDVELPPGTAFSVSCMGQPEIRDLAHKFVVQYYTVMREEPAQLHRFYKDDSAVIRENVTVLGQNHIHQEIMSKNIQNSRVAILRLDAMRANGNSVLIQVAGEMSVNNSAPRRFMQSFVLCEQALCDFYVLNDIFRYQDHVYGDINVENHSASNDSPKRVRQEASNVAPTVENVAQAHMGAWTEPTSGDSFGGESTDSVNPGCDLNRSEAAHPHESGEYDRESMPTPRSPGVTHSHSLPLEHETQPASVQQNSSWASVASKQLNQPPAPHVPKSARTQQGAANPQNPDDHSKATRPSLAPGQNATAPRRGGVNRFSGVTGEHNFSQDNRGAGHGTRPGPGRGGPMSGGMRGGGRGGRGSAGGSFSGRGAPFPRRGQ